MMRTQVRENLGLSVEYHEAQARLLGGEDHLDKYYARRQEGQGQAERQQQRRTRHAEGDESPDEAEAAPTEDKRSPEEQLADCHADAARQLRELLAAEPAEPAIARARRERDAGGFMRRVFGR